MSSSVKNSHKDVYLVINEKNETHMVKLLKNSCTCFASKNCAHIMAVRLFNGETIEPNRIHNLSELEGKKKR